MDVSRVTCPRRRRCAAALLTAAAAFVLGCGGGSGNLRVEEPDRRYPLLRQNLFLYAVAPGYTKALYQGRPGRPKAASTDTPTIASEYSVRSDHDLLLRIDRRVAALRGTVSVRARVLGSPPTEVPVENYVTINEKELKEERKVLFADDTQFFRDDAHDGLLKDLMALQATANEYEAFLRAGAGQGFLDLYGTATLEDWERRRVNEGSIPRMKMDALEPDPLAHAIAAVGSMSGADGEGRRKNVVALLGKVRSHLEDLFVFSELSAQLDDDELDDVRELAQEMNSKLGAWQAALTTTSAPAPAVLAACSAPTLFTVTKAFSATDVRGLKTTFAVGSTLRLDETSGRFRALAPRSSGELKLPATALANLERQTSPNCLDGALPAYAVAWNRHLLVLDEIQQYMGGQAPPDTQIRLAQVTNPAEVAPPAVAAAPSPARAPSPDDDGCALASDAPRSSDIFRALHDMRCIMRNGIEARLLRGLRNARVRLRPLKLEHGQRVEITVRVTFPGTALAARRADDPDANIDLEERFVVRVYEGGLSFRPGVLVSLVKRHSDVRVGTATETPSNWEPAAGVNLAWRIRTRRPWMDWVWPSVGLAVHAVNFDPRTHEIGLGPSLGILDEHVHLGVGWNLKVDDHHRFYWLSLDFARSYDSLKAALGGN